MRPIIFVFCSVLICIFSLSTPHFLSAAFQESAEESREVKSKKKRLIERTANILLKHHKINILSKPHTINVLPITFYDLRTGFNLGFRAVLKSRARSPYRYKLNLTILASHRGSHQHQLLFNYPSLANSDYGLRVLAKWRRDLEARYFGLGNNSKRQSEIIDKNSPTYIHEDFYIYNLQSSQMTVHGTRLIFDDVRFWFGFGFEFVHPQLKHGADASFLALDRPFGFLGGSGVHLSLRLVRDTRNEEILPRHGSLSEFVYEPNRASIKEEDKITGSPKSNRSVIFHRFTISNAQFLPLLQDRLVFANRMAFEAIAGDAPYYSMGEIAGHRTTRAVGGSQSLRGYKSRRFQDKFKFITLTEVRFNYRQFRFLTHRFNLIFIAFLDNGRVWSKWSEIVFKNFHSTYGIGVWFNWNSNMIIRFDLGRSPEGIVPYLRLSSSF